MKSLLFVIFLFFVGCNGTSPTPSKSIKDPHTFSVEQVGLKNEDSTSTYYLTDKKDKKMKALIQAQYGDKPNLDLSQYNSNGTSWSWTKMFEGIGIVGSIITRGIL